MQALLFVSYSDVSFPPLEINDRRSASDLAATRRVSFDAVPSRQQPVLTVASLPPPTIALSSTNEAQYNRGMGQHNKNVQNHNPYLATKRSLSDANRTAEPTTSRPRHELASIVVGPSRRTYRRDRQFGCSLEIPSSSTVGHDTANNESIQNTVSPNATSNSDPLTFDSTRKSFSGESIVGEADLEEPNDDADGLLSFVAFAAKRT